MMNSDSLTRHDNNELAAVIESKILIASSALVTVQCSAQLSVVHNVMYKKQLCR